MKILVIEDNATDSKLLSAVLQFSGHSVIEKTWAEQAVFEIKASQPDVVLLDLNLPGIGGLALAGHLKRDPQTRHIPIIAMTASTEKVTRKAALAAGCDAFILKPMDTRKVMDKIMDVVAPKGGRPPKGDAP